MVIMTTGALSRTSGRLDEHEISHDNIEILMLRVLMDVIDKMLVASSAFSTLYIMTTPALSHAGPGYLPWSISDTPTLNALQHRLLCFKQPRQIEHQHIKHPDPDR
jgi:hypothetical protein